MSNKFLSEREGQIIFFADLKISADVELTHNTDGVYRGTLFEFKLTISDINKVLFQAIKYLSHRRIKGENVPAQILLVALNEEIAYLFNSEDFLADIEKIYAGSASKNNTDFNTKIKPEKVNYSILKGLNRLTEILDVENYTKTHIDVFDVVGWASRFYQENPTASKIKLFKELRAPKHFASFIYPWTGDEKDFKYIMDLLNDKQHKKELGAFYTPPAYCLKATELVRKAISAIPEGHDYIILDRCAGTGSLEEFLTDKQVDDITIGELNHYIDKSLKAKYLQDKADIITTFYNKSNFNEITIGELEKHKTKISLHDYIFDNELSHTIANTYELKEWIVLNERIGDRVKLIIPPPQEVSNKDALVDGGDALSSQFVTGQTSLGMTKEYNESISILLGIVKDKKTNIILYENPPYRDMTASDKIAGRSPKKSFVYDEFVKAGTNQATHNDLANLFIWSGWKYYLSKPNDAFVLFSPIKYWKSLGLGEHTLIDGFLFNRAHFHAGQSAISCILWLNKSDSRESLELKAFDIDDKRTLEQEDDETFFVRNISVKKVYKSFYMYNDKRTFDDDQETDIVEEGPIDAKRNTKRRTIYNKNIIAHLRASSFNLDQLSLSLTRLPTYQNLVKSMGFYLRTDNFIEKLPLFAAKLYPQKNWYERDVYFTTADGGDRYLKDKDFLKTCFIFACLSQRNHCRSFDGSDGLFYKNELCFDKGTLASNKVKNYKLTKDEQDLLDTFNDMLAKAKHSKNYNKKYTYGTYQIDEELNTRFKNENDEWIYDYPELNTAINSLKTKLVKYYEAVIQPKLFEYELLK
ncbi:hypothetical protein EPN15_00610 [Patescibacteria group bacterium]|nr:MAG: hypothetical protein EPN15_00610 [Patescibacteria group bacterium]